MRKSFPILLLAYVAYLVFTTSCANPGMPTGGPKDTIPPVVIRTVPDFNGLNYHGNTVDLSFDEFVVTKDIQQQLVVSPPLKTNPVTRTKGKTLIVELGDSLKTNTTYSLDFKDAIVDNNEGNPLEGFRFAFSTGERFDTLLLGGYVLTAENLEPVEGATVVLHRDNSLEAFKDSIPDYIAKTDKEGFYVITNIAPGHYKLYALQDNDNSMTFNQDLEQIAFYKKTVSPEELNFPSSETKRQSADTVSITTKRKNALTDPFYLMMFEEHYFNQYLDSYKRNKANMANFYFSEPLTDSFEVKLLVPKPSPNWDYLEFNKGRDSLMVWVTDTLLANADTMRMELSYVVLDSLKNRVMKKDTVDLFYTKPERSKRRKKKEGPAPIPTFSFKQNLKSKGFNVYQNIKLEAPEPLKSFNQSMVHLYQFEDTIRHPIDFKLVQDSLSRRKFYLKYPWEYEERYLFEIDSAAAHDYYGHPSKKLSQKFEIQEESYYAKIILTISNLKGHGIVQLLDNSDKEKVLQKIRIDGDSQIEFPFLSPNKYKIRLILDVNNNGQWDPGNIEKGIEPEQVVYYPKILKLRSNFEIRESWPLPDNLDYQKVIIDEDKPKEDAKKKQNNTRR